MSRTRPNRVGVLLLALGIAALVLAALPLSARGATELLPDLDTSFTKPYVTKVGKRHYLTFTGNITNVGAGPLILRGHRASTAEPTMSVDQAIQLDDGTERIVPGVGTFEYDDEYARWGFTPYLRYELRRKNGRVLRAGAELGFCVVDWVDLDPNASLPGEPAYSIFGGCGKGDPSLLDLVEGVSVGWTNEHAGEKKGQLVDITGLASGDYLLVQRANVAGAVVESSLSNNASSALVRIKKGSKKQAPSVRLLKSCPDSATCKA